MEKDKENINEKNTDNNISKQPENETNTSTEDQEENENKLEEKPEAVEEDISEEDKLREEITILKEEKIRLLADMENLRKRFEREKIDSIKFGSVNFARDVLSPGDNLERALSAIDKKESLSPSIKNLIEGLLMVKKELDNVLEKNGISKIVSLDKKFDPNLHQAMMEVENDDLDEGIIVQEIQSGYMLHDRLLRPAMVGVSKKSSKESKDDVKAKPESENN